MYFLTATECTKSVFDRNFAQDASGSRSSRCCPILLNCLGKGQLLTIFYPIRRPWLSFWAPHPFKPLHHWATSYTNILFCVKAVSYTKEMAGHDVRLLHCVLSLAAQCIVIGPVCGFVCVCVWVCYHENSKLRASIFTKPGL